MDNGAWYISEVLPGLISAERKQMHKNLSLFLEPYLITGFHAMFLKNLLKGSSTLRELSASLCVNPASTTRAISHLISLGYVSDDKQRSNQKKYNISITESGKILAYKIKECIKNNFITRLSALTKDEQEQFIVLLKKLNTEK